MTAVFLLLAGASAQEPTHAGQSPSPLQGLTLPSTVTPFEFHSDFWINLHHFLYQQTLLDGAGKGQIAGSVVSLSAGDRLIWDQALAFYRGSMQGRDLLFDPRMVAIDSALAEDEKATSVGGPDLGTDLAKVLNEAAPIYRKYWWPTHDTANRFWIVTAEPLVHTCGTLLLNQLAGAYQTQWHSGSMRVDVTVYANWAGAYTPTVDPGHILIASTDSRNQGFAALEILFHEASHTIVSPNEGRIGQALAAAAKASNSAMPPDLWHALIFYTTGEFTRRDLSNLGVNDYEPYADRNGLWRGSWRDYRSALSLFWRKHLDDKLSIEEAVSKTVDALTTGTAAPPRQQ